jgi:hypothetical protein
MTKKETVALFALISSLFPRDDKFAKADKMMIMAWQEMLEDIPFEVAKAAVKATVATSQFPPSIKDIRDYSTRMNGKRRMTAEEAWGIASEMMRTYSARLVPIEGYIREEEPTAKFGEPVKIRKSGLEYEAKRYCPPDVWELMEHMGYADMCASENPDVIRGQFMRAWDSHTREEYEKRVIGGILPQFLKDMNLLNGGVNGELTE